MKQLNYALFVKNSGKVFFLISIVGILSACIPQAGQVDNASTQTGGQESLIGNVQSGTNENSITNTQVGITGDIIEFDTTGSLCKREGEKIVGGGHHGTIAIKEGHVIIASGSIAGGEVVIDMQTLTVADIPETNPSNAQLLDHLTNEDFFSTKAFSTARFVIDEVDSSTFPLITMTGSMTIKGQTHTETITATINDTMTALVGSVAIDRTKYGVMYNSTKLLDTLKDRAINDIFTLSFNLTTKTTMNLINPNQEDTQGTGEREAW